MTLAPWWQSIDLHELEERLEGWATFWRWRYGLDQTPSLEGSYRSPQPWDLPPIPAGLDVDAEDAQIVEQAVCAIDLYHHVLLKQWYIRRCAANVCLAQARRAVGDKARRRGDFNASLRMAKRLLANELERPAAVRRQRVSAYVRKILQLSPLTVGQA